MLKGIFQIYFVILQSFLDHLHFFLLIKLGLCSLLVCENRDSDLKWRHSYIVIHESKFKDTLWHILKSNSLICFSFIYQVKLKLVISIQLLILLIKCYTLKSGKELYYRWKRLDHVYIHTIPLACTVGC